MSKIPLYPSIEKALDYLFGSGNLSNLHVMLCTSPNFENPVSLSTVVAMYEEKQSLPPNVDPKLKTFLLNHHCKLGYALGSERFTAMLTLKLLGNSHIFSDSLVKVIMEYILEAFLGPKIPRTSFFPPLNVAAGLVADADSTSVATSGFIKVAQRNNFVFPKNQYFLSTTGIRNLVLEILGTASVADISSNKNISQGKNNGPLLRNVFRVYFEDSKFERLQVYPVANPEKHPCFMGLKHDAVVCANILEPIFFALQRELIKPEESIALEEIYVPQSQVPNKRIVRTGEAKISDIVNANLKFLLQHVSSENFFQKRTRYYPDPATFLCLSSLAIAQVNNSLAEKLRRVLQKRTQFALSTCNVSLSLAQLIIAAQALGWENRSLAKSKQKLISMQHKNGSWPAAPFYSFGTRHDILFGSKAFTTILCISSLVN